MAEFRSCIVPFPKRPSPLNELEPVSDSLQAEAELRAVMLGELLHEFAGPEGFHPEHLRLKVSVFAAQELLDEMVLLYRRAISEAQGGSCDG
ncbi:hypothetical protein D3C78_322060 [compost metagenome]